MNNLFSNLVPRLFAASLLVGCTLSIAGCENKEKVLEVETPGTEIDIERSEESGDVSIDINNKDAE